MSYKVVSQTIGRESLTKITLGPGCIFAALAVLALALLPALESVPTAKRVLDPQTPYGYSFSILLFALPVVVLALRNALDLGSVVARRALWITIGIYTSIGSLLDIFLGRLFFTFPNEGATLGWYLPGYDWQAGAWALCIPIEEFAFYGLGIAFVLAAYAWLNAHFLRLYRRDPAPQTGPILVSWGALAVSALLIALAMVIRAHGPAAGQPGFPGWAVFLIVFAFLPAGLFFHAVRDRINWQALAFVVLTMLLISVIWEVTLALPYQWWGFREEQMLGIYINAWTSMPIEEPALWVMVSFTTIISFEAVKMILERRQFVVARAGRDISVSSSL